jgi:hypothetical protein
MGSMGLKMTRRESQLVAAPTTKPNRGNTTKPCDVMNDVVEEEDEEEKKIREDTGY